MAFPSDAEQPGLWLDGDGLAGQMWVRPGASGPALEVGRRGEGIEIPGSQSLPAGGQLAPAVVEHVGECAAHLLGRAQGLSMVALTKQLSPTAEERVETLGQPYLKALHTSGEDLLVLRLDDHVQVIALHRELHDPEPLLVRKLHAATNPPKDPRATQRRCTFDEPQRDVQRCPPGQRWPASMRHARSLPTRNGLPPRSRPPTTPTCPARSQCQLFTTNHSRQ
mgnify:CR=1 FL=1